MSTLATEIAEAKARLEAVLARIADEVEKLPDNPRITRLGDGKAFTISSRHLGLNWTPGYHDFKHQYRAIAEILREGNVMTALDRLRTIISTRLLSDTAGRRRHIHPEVAGHLRTMLEADSGEATQGVPP